MALQYTSITAGASQTLALKNCRTVLIKNDGTGDCYVRLFSNSDSEPTTAAGYAATNADALVKSTDNVLIFIDPGGFRCISVYSAVTPTVRLFFLP